MPHGALDGLVGSGLLCRMANPNTRLRAAHDGAHHADPAVWFVAAALTIGTRRLTAVADVP